MGVQHVEPTGLVASIRWGAWGEPLYDPVTDTSYGFRKALLAEVSDGGIVWMEEQTSDR